MIAAIFIAILLLKESHTIVLFYLIYIGYFYFNKQKDVKTLEITASFLLFITLSQYLILLLRQRVKGDQNQEFEIWAYILRFISPTIFDPKTVDTLSLKIFGPLSKPALTGTTTSIQTQNSNDQIKLELDAIPTIVF